MIFPSLFLPFRLQVHLHRQRRLFGHQGSVRTASREQAVGTRRPRDQESQLSRRLHRRLRTLHRRDEDQPVRPAGAVREEFERHVRQVLADHLQTRQRDHPLRGFSEARARHHPEDVDAEGPQVRRPAEALRGHTRLGSPLRQGEGPQDDPTWGRRRGPH